MPVRRSVPLKVLVPLDGSEASFRALTGALQILEGRGGLQLTLLNVVSQGMADAPDEIVEKYDEDEHDEVFPTVASAERMLERAEQICREHGVEAHHEIVTGGVIESILAACEKHDVLVMHQLERRQLKETMRGSQTEKLARRAGINVLLVRTD